MTRRDQSAWVTCASPSCTAGTWADPRHLDNITAAGGWLCPTHRPNTPKENPPC